MPSCPRAASGHAATPPSAASNSRRPMTGMRPSRARCVMGLAGGERLLDRGRHRGGHRGRRPHRPRHREHAPGFSRRPRGVCKAI